MKKPDIKRMIDKYGYERTKRKLRNLGFSKKEVFDMTDFLFVGEI